MKRCRSGKRRAKIEIMKKKEGNNKSMNNNRMKRREKKEEGRGIVKAKEKGGRRR